MWKEGRAREKSAREGGKEGRAGGSAAGNRLAQTGVVEPGVGKNGGELPSGRPKHIPYPCPHHGKSG